MGGGILASDGRSYHLIDITTKTFKFCLKYGRGFKNTYFWNFNL